MDKGLGNESSSISSSSASIATNSNSNSNMFLKQVNKNSHKIAKPIRKPLPLSNPTAAPPPPTIPVIDPNPHNPGPGHAPPQSQQPPVYNINKNDFRDVVQKLTGSPAHERLPTPPPPVTHPRLPSSRLQRIRPPPLAQISNRPNQIPQILPRPQNDAGQRPPAHAQPLPPLPSVHPAAESPISAYMRFLQNSASSVAPSPLWNSVAPIGGPRPDSLLPPNEFGQRPPLQPAESPISAYMRFLQNSAGSSSAAPPPQPPPVAPPPPPVAPPPPLTSSAPFPAMPLSPLPFGCMPSPKSPYGMMSPGFLFSPTGQLGLPQLPLSPTLPVPSPRWKGM